MRQGKVGSQAGSKIPTFLLTYPYTDISSFQFSRSVVSDSLWPHESQHARPPYPSPTPRVYSNSCPSSRWCHPAISPSVIPFSSTPIPPSISVFYNKSTLRMRWQKKKKVFFKNNFSLSKSFRLLEILEMEPLVLIQIF